MHFGFPYCHQGDLSDPEFGKGKSCASYTPPAQKLKPHTAALGALFYTGDMFPAEYKNQLFIAEHGSWNRSTKIGYCVSVVKIAENYQTVTSYQNFVEGWLAENKEDVYGRPVSLLQLDDGSVLVSDDYSDIIYRITYEK
jgi:glucose/arabinose dehydrogenase